MCNTNYDLILHHAFIANVFKINSSEVFVWVILDRVVVLNPAEKIWARF